MGLPVFDRVGEVGVEAGPKQATHSKKHQDDGEDAEIVDEPLLSFGVFSRSESMSSSYCVPVIYALLCPESKSFRYVGQTTLRLEDRLRGHILRFRSLAKENPKFRKTHKHAWFHRLEEMGLLDNLRIVEIESCVQNELDFREQYWINCYRRIGLFLTNTTPGGRQPRGYRRFPHSEETKSKMSDAATRVWQSWTREKIDRRREKRFETNLARCGRKSPQLSDDARRKIGVAASKRVGQLNPFFGQTHSISARLEISEKAKTRTGSLNSFHGRKHSEETKAKIAETLRARRTLRT
jgi:group I intron endonuclease